MKDLKNQPARPIITLTTDFGTQDGYVGAMKGRIHSICPDAKIVDISHEISPQDIRQASWTVARAAMMFPVATIHVVVVDPGVGSERKPLLLKIEDQWFVGPDNGVFSELIRKHGTEEVHEIKTQTEWWQAHSSFDGLALFSPAAAHLAQGVSLDRIVKPLSSVMTLLPMPKVTESPGSLSGEIIQFDRFGNALTNISHIRLKKEGLDVRKINCRDNRFQFVNHFAEGKDKAPIALINSDGYLELSIFCGSAQDQLGLKAGDRVTVRFVT